MKKYDITRMNELVASGKLMVQTHPTLPLSIYKYTAETQYSKNWDEYTRAARGLVLDAEGNAWSNPIPKFMNIEELVPSEIPDLPYEITDKIDGSCIEVFWYNGHLIVCTLGSFQSDQAKLAEDMLKSVGKIISQTVLDFNYVFQEGKTYIFELVAPENRIVLDYGTDKKLVLITVRDNDTDEETLPNYLGFPVVEKVSKSLAEVLVEKHRTDFINAEGFVVKFSNGFRVKVKYEQYFILHRLVTGLSKKYVWEFMSEGKELIFDSIPDEFFQQVETWKKELQDEYNGIEQIAKEVFAFIYIPTESRKDFAMKAMEHRGISSILFKMWMKQPYNILIWKQIEPKFTDSVGFNSFRK